MLDFAKKLISEIKNSCKRAWNWAFSSRTVREVTEEGDGFVITQIVRVDPPRIKVAVSSVFNFMLNMVKHPITTAKWLALPMLSVVAFYFLLDSWVLAICTTILWIVVASLGLLVGGVGTMMCIKDDPSKFGLQLSVA